MKVYKILIITTFLVAFLICTTNADNNKQNEKEKDCIKKCGGNEKLEEADRKAEVLCIQEPENTNNTNAFTPCIIECLETSPSEDQDKCFCDLCKLKPDRFCAKPNEPHVEQKECDTVVCKEKKAKYFGTSCKKKSKGGLLKVLG